MSEDKWRPMSGAINWVQHQIALGTDPMELLREILPEACSHIPPRVDNLTLWKLILNVLSESPQREKLPNVNTLEDVVDLIKKCSNIIVLTGAGVSVSCGIPDFRSQNGVYARLSEIFPELPDPQAMFDIHYFRDDPRPFFKFAKEIYPGQFQPSISHKFIKLIENNGKLLRNYTQNIDTLEKAAGIEKVVTCHGSFSTASCIRCGHKVDSEAIKEDIFAQRIPECPRCPEDCEEIAVMKPDIVFFGESLSEEFHDSMAIDKDKCDLLIVMGSSMKVRPVSQIPSAIPPEVPRILINREPLDHICFDVELLGDCDDTVQEICKRLGGDWTNICSKDKEEDKESPLVEGETNNNQHLDSASKENNVDESDSSNSSNLASPVGPDIETNVRMAALPDSTNRDDQMKPESSHDASS